MARYPQSGFVTFNLAVAMVSNVLGVEIGGFGTLTIVKELYDEHVS